MQQPRVRGLNDGAAAHVLTPGLRIARPRLRLRLLGFRLLSFRLLGFGLLSFGLLGFGLLGCAAPDPLEGPPGAVAAARAFIEDSAARRAALEASVEPAPDVDYATLRLRTYAPPDGGDVFGALPRITLRVRPLVVGGSDAPFEEVAALEDLETLADYEREGSRAFERFPVQPDPAFRGLRDEGVAERHGLLVRDGVVHGAVEVETDGGPLVALTCAGCHDAPRGAEVVRGVGNAWLRYGELFGIGDWRPGTMDVTADGLFNPVRPSDLRAIAGQARLHHAANLANGRLARMVRIETLIAGRFNYGSRPDRRLVAAVALYLESLSRTLPAHNPGLPGGALFADHCESCHQGANLAGPGVAARVVATDDAASRGARGFGFYRAPSLRGVADRGSLLHDASVPSLRALLRLEPSAHVGHPFGTALSESERAALIEFLSP